MERILRKYCGKPPPWWGRLDTPTWIFCTDASSGTGWTWQYIITSYIISMKQLLQGALTLWVESLFLYHFPARRHKTKSQGVLNSPIVCVISSQCGNPSVLLNSFWNRDLIGQLSSRDPMLECDWSTARAAARMPRHNMPPVLSVDLLGASSSK